MEEARAKHAAAAAEASDVKQSLADKELLLVAAAPANGDVGEDAVGIPPFRSVLDLSAHQCDRARLTWPTLFC